jgi:cytoskeletal protein CcmA (bactofilin family)
MGSEDRSLASLGKSVEIRGEVKGSEDLTIDGRVKGTIVLTDSRLTIGSSAHVDADVSARDVVILGTVSGNVHASACVDLRMGCNLKGDIFAARLSIEDGASFTGKVDLTQRTSPASSPAIAPKAAVTPAAVKAGASASGLFSGEART